MKVQELFEAVASVPTFEAYLYKQKEFKKEFSDLAEVEDLFDYAYLEDISMETAAIAFAEKGKVPPVEKVEKELMSRIKFLASNMENKKQWKDIVLQHGEKWAKKAAPQIAKMVPNYID